MIKGKRKTFLIKNIAIITCNKLSNISFVPFSTFSLISLSYLARIMIYICIISAIRFIPFLVLVTYCLFAFMGVDEDSVNKKYLLIPVLFDIIVISFTKKYFNLVYIVPNLIGFSFFSSIGQLNFKKMKILGKLLVVSFIFFCFVSLRDYFLIETYKNISLLCFSFVYLSLFCSYICIIYGDYYRFLDDLHKAAFQLPMAPLVFEIFSTTNNLYSYLS